jgi:hypothetical protein
LNSFAPLTKLSNTSSSTLELTIFPHPLLPEVQPLFRVEQIKDLVQKTG